MKVLAFTLLLPLLLSICLEHAASVSPSRATATRSGPLPSTNDATRVMLPMPSMSLGAENLAPHPASIPHNTDRVFGPAPCQCLYDIKRVSGPATCLCLSPHRSTFVVPPWVRVIGHHCGLAVG